ncbi:MAG: hypothetical protein CM15mP49_34370 [Actinomycetota bacterium]|nr:MAG: hypothetical protein CM15mP49_34370 [Actinomycetota bacterium]
MCERLKARDWGRKEISPIAYELDEWFTELPENFHDDLHTKPDVHRRWMHAMLKWGAPGTMNRKTNICGFVILTTTSNCTN